MFIADLSVHLCLIWFLGGMWESWGPILKLLQKFSLCLYCSETALYSPWEEKAGAVYLYARQLKEYQ